jgi:hypothetical protein
MQEEYEKRIKVEQVTPVNMQYFDPFSLIAIVIA